MRLPSYLFPAPLAVLLTAACAPTPPPQDASLATVRHRPSGGDHGPKIAAEVGALDEHVVQEAFDAARASVGECFARANERLRWPMVGGDVEVVVRVRHDGSVRWIFPVRSTLGDREAERCILDALGAQHWPKPQGGDEGIARGPYGSDAPGREPVAWAPSDLGHAGDELRAKLHACGREKGGAVSVTLYVDPNGKPVTAGAASDDEHGIEALDCAVEAAMGLRYPSPGSYPAKVTVAGR